MGIRIVVAALLLKLLFRTQTLGAHAVFALHYVAFLYLMAIVVGASQQSISVGAGPLAIPLTYGIIVPYLYIALRRVDRQRRVVTIAKVLVVCAVTFVVDNAVNASALLVRLWLV